MLDPRLVRCVPTPALSGLPRAVSHAQVSAWLILHVSFVVVIVQLLVGWWFRVDRAPVRLADSAQT